LSDASGQPRRILASWRMARPSVGEPWLTTGMHRPGNCSPKPLPGPFVGNHNTPNVNSYTVCRPASTTYAKFNPGNVYRPNAVHVLRNSIWNGAAFICTAPSGRRFVKEKVSAIAFEPRGLAVPCSLSGAAKRRLAHDRPLVRPQSRAAVRIGGFPVYTNPWLPCDEPVGSRRPAKTEKKKKSSMIFVT